MSAELIARVIDALGITWRGGRHDDFLVCGELWPLRAMVKAVRLKARDMGWTIKLKPEYNEIVSEIELVLMWVREHRKERVTADEQGRIEIMIRGARATGKSLLARHLAGILRQAGHAVLCDDGVGGDLPKVGEVSNGQTIKASIITINTVAWEGSR